MENMRAVLKIAAGLGILPISVAASALLAALGVFGGWLLLSDGSMGELLADCPELGHRWSGASQTIQGALLIGSGLALAAAASSLIAYLGWFLLLPRPSSVVESASSPWRTALCGISWAALVALLAAAAALAVFGAGLGAAMTAAAGALIRLAANGRRGRAPRALSLLVAPALLLAAVAVSADPVTVSMRRLGDRALAQGPESLTVPERAALWVLAAAMPVGGVALGAPQAALEQTRLLLPGRAEVVRHSDFPMRSPRIRRFVEENRAGPGATAALRWDGYYDEFPHHDIALLFNGGSISVARIDGACRAEAVVEVSYKPQYRGSTLLDIFGVQFRVDQAAYWALQEVGWLFPHRLRVRWPC